MLHAARCKCRTQKSRQKSPSGHHPTTLSGYIFTTKACIDNQKKNLSSSNISYTCPHNMVNFGPLAAEIVLLVWGTPGNFNGFRILAALLHGTLVVGVSQTAALNRGRHLYSAGRPSRWALAHILVVFIFCYSTFLFEWWVRAFLVLGLVLPHQAKRLAGGTSPKWPVLCRVGHKTLTQALNGTCSTDFNCENHPLFLSYLSFLDHQLTA